MAITGIRAGMLTTVQDLGRPGHRVAGVPPGGAMDAFALRLVNLLVGNAEKAAGLDVEFKVSPKSDRMGVRLIGPALVRHTAMELVSAPTVPGTVQVPPDGQPIALMADAQTLGGYPQIAHAITVDLPLLAQARPGNTVRFRRVTLETAHRLLNAREHALALLREGLLGKLR